MWLIVKPPVMGIDYKYVQPEKISRRDYFAAMALQGMLMSDRNKKVTQQLIVERSIELADELIKQLDVSNSVNSG